MTIYQLINDKGNAARNQFVVIKNNKIYCREGRQED